ncbi:MAG: helix-turn-helix domain-containing protein [Mycobacteriaceae bacterium]|nr:helix-turn-helix domain-containing protein [Mycobacteriaceae bacterium]
MDSLRFDTEVLDPPDRFSAWFDLATANHVPSYMRSEHERDFRAGLHVLELGPVRIASLWLPSFTVSRTERQVRQSDPEMIQFDWARGGAAGVEQEGIQTSMDPGTASLMHTSSPFRCWGTRERGDYLTVQVPRTVMLARVGGVERLTRAPLRMHRGLGVVLAAHLDTVLANGDDYTEAEGALLGEVTLDLLVGLCSTAAPTESLPARIKLYIKEHLGDPGLGPAGIAAAHRISVRYLHRIFQDEDMTVASYIRAQRLEQCRRELADPRYDTRPAHAIGARWGLTDAPHFTRAFRAAYHLTPAQYRLSVR